MKEFLPLVEDLKYSSLPCSAWWRHHADWTLYLRVVVVWSSSFSFIAVFSSKSFVLLYVVKIDWSDITDLLRCVNTDLLNCVNIDLLSFVNNDFRRCINNDLLCCVNIDLLSYVNIDLLSCVSTKLRSCVNIDLLSCIILTCLALQTLTYLDV